MSNEALWMVVVLILIVALAGDTWANIKIIRMLEKEETPEEDTRGRKWHL